MHVHESYNVEWKKSKLWNNVSNYFYKKGKNNSLSDYQNKLSEEYTKLLSGGQCSLEENQINDASNMMEHFIKRLNNTWAFIPGN